MNIGCLPLLAALFAPTAFSANLAISTYLKDGFTPTAIAADAQGNIYLAGRAVIDQASQATSAAVAKVNPKVTQFLYFAYLDSAASDQVTAIAVDSSGNAYIAGSTTNPGFPAFGGGALGTAPAGGTDARSFVTKLSPQGVVVFSVLIGGSAVSTAQGIAITPQGQILVSGIANSKGFPSTPGAYAVADSNNQWFLMELDAAASKVIFSATGIGGSSIVPDAAGNIYMAGSNYGTSYPTTPGAYQTTFSQGTYCFGFCRFGFSGGLQHITKTDAAATKLVYSTGLNDPSGLAGSTTNTGLAVDSAGNAYVTGTLFEAQYPFTVTAPDGTSSYLTKLDPTGANVLFSVPVGGGGVRWDSAGAIYVGGTVTSLAPTLFPRLPGPLPAVAIPQVFSWIPRVCVPNFTTAVSEAYVMKVDPSTGVVQDAQWIDGSAPGATGIVLAGGKVWITGATPGPQVPTTPGALTTQPLGPGFLAGAYLSAVDFGAAAAAGPSVACVLDGGNLSHVGSVAAFQLISIFGAGLGPSTPVQAADGGGPSLGGVSVTFDGAPAQLLYVSSSQINVAVPPPLASGSQKTATVMQLTYNGASVQRQLPFTASSLNLFADLSTAQNPCPGYPSSAVGFQPVAQNADGSANSCTNPARPGSTLSLFAHGVGGFGVPALQLVNLHASFGFGCTALVTNASLITSFVYKLDVSLPASIAPCNQVFNGIQGTPLTLSYNDEPVGPFSIPVDSAGSQLSFSPPGKPMRMIVWIGQ